MNMRPRRCAMDLRHHRARNLIVQSDQAQTEIAVACGFTSTSLFPKSTASALATRRQVGGPSSTRASRKETHELFSGKDSLGDGCRRRHRCGDCQAPSI
ncbi:hypothetical protein [Rhizobium freirei]|uniref:hypothetical protein n=1 Tax=Rhizobium freirei TaxID=1353277 RepID=UPI0009DA8E3D